MVDADGSKSKIEGGTTPSSIPICILRALFDGKSSYDEEPLLSFALLIERRVRL